jgi:hypothetical protein
MMASQRGKKMSTDAHIRMAKELKHALMLSVRLQKRLLELNITDSASIDTIKELNETLMISTKEVKELLWQSI